MLPSEVKFPFSTSISRVDKAFLASPSDSKAIFLRYSSDITTLLFKKPSGAFNACFKILTISSIESDFRTNTLHLDKRALLSSNDGFSVVAPIKIMLPFSTYGKNASCCVI